MCDVAVTGNQLAFGVAGHLAQGAIDTEPHAIAANESHSDGSFFKREPEAFHTAGFGRSFALALQLLAQLFFMLQLRDVDAGANVAVENIAGRKPRNPVAENPSILTICAAQP